MNDNIDINIIHIRLLKLAKLFHTILLQEGVPYYMIGGTMLGAVRHEGFIPWDDDMDFGVPRPYYEIARHALKMQLSSQYRILDVDNELVSGDYFKIEDTNTIVQEEGDFIDTDATRRGLSIDIFPLDYCDDKWSFFSKNRIIPQLMFYNTFRYRTNLKGMYKLIQGIIRLFPKNFLLKHAHRMINKEGSYMINYSGLAGKKELINKDVFGIPKKYKFEDIELYGVALSNDYLTSIYGDYMKLPPIEKRRTHLISFEYIAE